MQALGLGSRRAALHLTLAAVARRARGAAARGAASDRFWTGLERRDQRCTSPVRAECRPGRFIGAVHGRRLGPRLRLHFPEGGARLPARGARDRARAALSRGESLARDRRRRVRRRRSERHPNLDSSSCATANLWPGIDMVFRGTNAQLKYEFLVRPGARVSDIRLAYAGAESAFRGRRNGSLAIATLARHAARRSAEVESRAADAVDSRGTPCPDRATASRSAPMTGRGLW